MGRYKLIAFVLSAALAGVGSWVIIIQGIIFVVCVLSFRSGMIGVPAPRVKRRGITG